MRTRLQSFTVAFSCLISIASTAQNDIELNITHTLNEDNFALFQESQTPDDLKFNLDRMEYYLSSFNFVHDGGQVTQFDSVWALVNATGQTTIDLGQADITSIESVGFSIGVEQEFNHLDPSTWPAGHPLAHHNPSMHWGWSSGYRFIAIEGMGGDELDQIFEIHSLGDQNFVSTSIDVEVEAQNGAIAVPLYANISMALKDIDVSNGVIVHGFVGPAVTIAENFRDYVFTAEAYVDTTSQEDSTNSIAELNNGPAFSLVSNPSLDGSIKVMIDAQDIKELSLEVYDITGKSIDHMNTLKPSAVQIIEGLERGVYLVKISNTKNGTFTTRKALVQ